MGFYHTGCMNFHDAYKLLCEAEGHHSMALLDRYCAMPLIPENPYADPPPGFVPPGDVTKDGELERDAHGLWRRDKLPAPRENVLKGMRAIKDFIEGKPNSVARFEDSGAELFRLVDSVNWSAAERLQYIDEDKAARLRQLQRFLYDFSIAQMLLDVQKAASHHPTSTEAPAGAAQGAAAAEVAPRATVQTARVRKEHVQRAICHLAAIWEGHESFVNPRRTMYLEENVWRGTLAEQRAAAAHAEADAGAAEMADVRGNEADGGSELPAGWSQKMWEGTPYYHPQDNEGAWQYERPAGGPALGAPTSTVPQLPQGVDEYVFVGILDPALKSRMITGVDDAEVTWGETDLIASACKTTLIWKCSTAENRVTGNMISTAIRASHVPWPTLSWWKACVVEGELLAAGLGRKSDHNAGGGFWEKPKIPTDESERAEFEEKLAQWGVSLDDYGRSWFTGAAAAGAAPARRGGRATRRAPAPSSGVEPASPDRAAPQHARSSPSSGARKKRRGPQGTARPSAAVPSASPAPRALASTFNTPRQAR